LGIKKLGVEREGAEWVVVREGVGQGGEMTQALYAHMNNKTIKKENPAITRECCIIKGD
jgi:hypothetical protein